jgi:hypothetical protein
LRTVAALPANTAYPAGNLAKPISSLAKGYPEDIRILALDALTNLGDAAFRNLAFDLYADENESAEIRRKAGQTFLALLPAAPMLAEDQRGILRKMTSAEDSILASQAVHALGIAAVPAAERKKQLNKMDDETPALR